MTRLRPTGMKNSCIPTRVRLWFLSCIPHCSLCCACHFLLRALFLHRPPSEDSDTKKGSTRFLPSMFSMREKKGSAEAEAAEQEVRPGITNDLDDSENGSQLSLESPLKSPIKHTVSEESMADSPLPGAVAQELPPQPPKIYEAWHAQGAADNHNEILVKQAKQVRNTAMLINSHYDDSSSSGAEAEREGLFDRITHLRQEDQRSVENSGSVPKKALGVVKFERRKKQIAARFQTRRDMVLFEKEEGPNIGGQWIDQKWVPNSVLNVTKNQFTINKWAKDLVSYLILLFAFTYIIFTSSGYSEFVAYQRVWRRLLRPRAAAITTPASALVAIERLVLDDLVAGKRPYVDGFYAPGGAGTDVLLGSILVGKIRLRQLRVNGVPCTRVHQMLKDYGMVSSKECYPPYTKLNEAIIYEKENKERQQIYENEKQYPYFIHKDALQTNLPEIEGQFGKYSSGGYIATFDLDDANTTLADLREFQWVDKKTRVLFMDFAYYNDDLGLFVAVNIMVEFASGQAPVPTVSASAISPMRFRSGTYS